MPLRLPPLPALRLFEAAGRLRSFKLAAAELNVTPSAVSHGIVGLEQQLGVVLFERRPRGLSLTQVGADYLTYVGEALSLIAVGTQRLPGSAAARSIAVSCAPTLAQRWLLPRLKSYCERWPKTTILVDTSRRHVGFPVDGFDFAIRMSRAPVGGLAWVKLLSASLVPACSPAYRAGMVDREGRIDLRRATLIHVTTVSDGWQSWLKAEGLDDIDVEGGLRVDTFELAFEAAGMGLGVVLGLRPLVDRDLETGRLVALGARARASPTAYWLVSAPGTERRTDLRRFKRWLVGEAQVAPAW